MSLTTLAKKSLSTSISALPPHRKTRDGNFVVSSQTDVAFHGGGGLADVDVRGNETRDMFVSFDFMDERDVATSEAIIIASPSEKQPEPGAQWAREQYWAAPGRSAYDEMMAIVVVSWPLPEGVPILRPPAIGNGIIAKFLRSAPIPESRVNVAKLPSTIRLADLGVPVPPISYYEKLFGDFCGELWDGWSTDTKTPDLQHPGYGTYLASVVSQALVVLCSSDYTVEQKAPLAILMTQWGLDLAAAFADGRDNRDIGNGHMMGRKALIILAGHLLGIPQMADPCSILGPVFAEDNAYVGGQWWHGNPTWNAIWQGRRFTNFMHKPPSQWTTEAQTGNQHRSQCFSVHGYLGHVVGASVGTAVAMDAMLLFDQMGIRFMDMVKQFMQGPGEAADADLRAVGVIVPWGQCYAVVAGVGMCSAAWRQMP